MISKPSTTYPDHLRLANVLTDLSETKLSAGKHNLAERLGHLLGLSGSVALSRALQELPQTSKFAGVDGDDVLYEKVLAARSRMTLKIIASFEHRNRNLTPTADQSLSSTAAPIAASAIEEDSVSQIAKGSSSNTTSGAEYKGADGLQNRVPSADASIREQTLKTFAPYRRFYIAQQGEMAIGIQNLRIQVRNGVATKSAELHQLAELDTVFEQSLASQNQRLFAMDLKILERRFNFLLKTHGQSSDQGAVEGLDSWLSPGAWLDLFYQDTRELLLAEFDVRMQPVLGLLEALNEPIR